MTIFAHEQYNQAWKIYTVNFTTQGDDCDDSSYEMWDYTRPCGDENNILGVEMKLKRRKEDSTCFNGDNFERTIQTTECDECKLKVTKKFLFSKLIIDSPNLISATHSTLKTGLAVAMISLSCNSLPIYDVIESKIDNDVINL